MDKVSPPILQMQGIVKSFFGVQVLKKVNFDLNCGEVHVLLGENGAGKSTLMKILSAAYQAEDGRILIDGQLCHFRHPHDAQAAGISTIYQHLSQAPHLSVAENIFLGRPPQTRLGLIDWERMRKEARQALDAVGVRLNVDASVRSLSIAERQLIEIATALRRNARILIMDEPTAALTDRERGHLFDLIRQLKANGVGIIYISHRLDEIEQIGDRVTVLRDGEEVGTRSVSNVSGQQLVSMMVGRELLQTQLPPLPTNLSEALRVEGLTQPGEFAEVSFVVNRGEVVSLAGLVGAGRTAVAEAIFGARPAASGAIYVDGQLARIRHPADAGRYGIGFATEDRASTGLALALSVRDNMTLPLVARDVRRLGSAWLLNRQREENLVNTYRRELDVRAHHLDDAVRYLSGGNQQKVILAKWLMARCRILILDEPTFGIDVGAKEEIHGLILAFARERGAVLLISSDLPEVLKLSDRVLVMASGRLQGEFARSEASEERVMTYAMRMQS